MEAELLDLIAARRGHFRLESGHHGNLWFDLDSLFLRPVRWMPFARGLAAQLSAHRVEAVVGPLVGGAFVAQMVAAELDLHCAFAERLADAQCVTYHIPDSIHDFLRGKTVASPFFEENDLAVESIARLPNELWEPAACPLCAAGVPLSSPAHAG